MKRREFIAVLAVATVARSVARSVAAHAQSSGAVHHVGLLGPSAPIGDKSPMVEGLSAGFTKRGYVIDPGLVFARRAALGHVERLPQLVQELVARGAS